MGKFCILIIMALSLGCATEMAKVNAALTKAEAKVTEACDKYQRYLEQQALIVKSISDKTAPIEDTAIRLARDICRGARAVSPADDPTE